MIALIPARLGSQRIPGKNTRLLAGHPVVAYTIMAALQSGIFSRVLVCSDDERVLRVAAELGARAHLRKPVPDRQPDIEWVQEVRDQIDDAFAILRPTSPFRSVASIRAAWAALKSQKWADSVRAVTPWTGPHPAKMWYPQGKRIDRIKPVWEGELDGTPWHSSPTQTLKPVYVQTAGLEIAWIARTLDAGTIAGTQVLPYLLHGPEALDLNTEADFAEAERIAAEHPDLLPRIGVAA